MALDNLKDKNSVDVMKEVCKDAGLNFSDDGSLIPGKVAGGFKFNNATHREVLDEMCRSTGTKGEAN